jgi:menaquinone-specific isochorismate synthase
MLLYLRLNYLCNFTELSIFFENFELFLIHRHFSDKKLHPLESDKRKKPNSDHHGTPVLIPGMYQAYIDASKIALESGKSSLFSVTLAFENTDPLAVLELLGVKNQFQFYWEHPEESLSIAAGNALKQLKARGSDRFRVISKKISQWKKRTVEYAEFEHSLNGVFFLGGFSFFGHKAKTHWQIFDAASFTVPEWVFIRDGQLSLLTLVTEIRGDEDSESGYNSVISRLEYLSDRINKGIKNEFFPVPDSAGLEFDIADRPDEFRRWKEGINNAKDLIRDNRFDKIVLARSLSIEATREISPTRLANHLRREYPSCFTFLLQINDSATFIGSSPERLFSYRPSLILTEALAGSISRGKTATEDAILEKKLHNSQKDQEEHRYVVSAISDKLKQFSKDLEYPDNPGVKKFSNVQHLFTPITAWLHNQADPFDLIELLHPTPAVGGYPGHESNRYIQQFEHFERGWYAAPVGWYNNRNRGEFLVGIRSGLIYRNKASFFAGCGIVADSVPEQEWKETELKLIPMLSALRHG